MKHACVYNYFMLRFRTVLAGLNVAQAAYNLRTYNQSRLAAGRRRRELRSQFARPSLSQRCRHFRVGQTDDDLLAD